MRNDITKKRNIIKKKKQVETNDIEFQEEELDTEMTENVNNSETGYEKSDIEMEEKTNESDIVMEEKVNKSEDSEMKFDTIMDNKINKSEAVHVPENISDKYKKKPEVDRSKIKKFHRGKDGKFKSAKSEKSNQERVTISEITN